MSLFRGKGCLYGCLGAVSAVILSVLGGVGFGFYKLRETCIEKTVLLTQARETCKLTDTASADAKEPKTAQKLIARLEPLAQIPGSSVTLSAIEVQTLMNYILSRPLPEQTIDKDASIVLMGFLVNDWLKETLINVSISKDGLTICAVTPVDGSPLSWCPATGGRAAVVQATLVPSTEIPGQPLTLAEAQLGKTKVQSTDLSSFQKGLYTILAENHDSTDSSLLQTFISKIDKVTLEEGSLTLHPKRSPGDSGNAQ